MRRLASSRPRTRRSLTTTLRDGNFDYVTHSVKWDRTPQLIPNSLYLTAKPAFFGTVPWPWVDSIGPMKLVQLPARQRFETWFARRSRFGPQPPGVPIPCRNALIRLMALADPIVY